MAIILILLVYRTFYEFPHLKDKGEKKKKEFNKFLIGLQISWLHILCTVKTGGVLPLRLQIQWQQTLNRGVEITTAILKLGNTRLYSH